MGTGAEGRDIDGLLACAIEAAKVGGKHASANLHRRSETLKITNHDVKLQLDVECQEKVSAVIRHHFTQHTIIGEEDLAEGQERGSARTDELSWVVDPIDGTVNFSHGLPLWCCSVAVRTGDKDLAGVVYAPELKKIFVAATGRPAECNGQPIRVSEVDNLARAVVFTGTNQQMHPDRSPFRFFQALAENVQRPRISGSAALDLCRVASGMGDGYFESGIYTWDVAAAGLIVRQAGGRAEVLERTGTDSLLYLASNASIHEALKRVVAAALRLTP